MNNSPDWQTEIGEFINKKIPDGFHFGYYAFSETKPLIKKMIFFGGNAASNRNLGQGFIEVGNLLIKN